MLVKDLTLFSVGDSFNFFGGRGGALATCTVT